MNARLIIVRNIISRPQTGQMTSFAGVTFSFICIDRCNASSDHDMDQSSLGKRSPNIENNCPENRCANDVYMGDNVHASRDSTPKNCSDVPG